MNKLSQVATAANGVRKPTKASTHAMLCNLINELESKGVNLSSDGEFALQAFYSYFLDPTKSPKDKFDLLRMFRGKKDVRYYLNAIYSDGEWLMAANGHVAVRFKTDLPVGYYDDALTPIKVDGRYPDIGRVMAKKKGRTRYQVSQETLSVIQVKPPKGGVLHCSKVGCVAIQIAYLNPLLKTGPIDVYLDETLTDRAAEMQSVAIELTNPAYEGVEVTVMPVRV